jgi:hypothetical protein
MVGLPSRSQFERVDLTTPECVDLTTSEPTGSTRGNISAMAVSISQTVGQIGPDIWRMGSKIICERDPIAPTTPLNVLAAWQDGNCTFILRLTRDENVDLASSSHRSIKLIHEGGTASAVWSIGSGAFCKVKVWFPGLQSGGARTSHS